MNPPDVTVDEWCVKQLRTLCQIPITVTDGNIKSALYICHYHLTRLLPIPKAPPPAPPKFYWTKNGNEYTVGNYRIVEHAKNACILYRDGAVLTSHRSLHGAKEAARRLRAAEKGAN